MTAPDDTQLIQALERDLAPSGHVPDAAQWVRLKGGRTNHVWRITGPTGANPVVVKLYAETSGNPLFPNRPDDEARVLHALDGQGMAPRLLHRTATRLGPCVVYSHVSGARWRDDPAKVARLLRRLHGLAPPRGLRPAPDGSVALEAQIAAILARCPGDVQNMPGLPDTAVPPSGAACLLHGDPVPGNLIAQGAALHLIDWQCPAIGDPCEDIALFLSPAMQIAYRGAPLAQTEEQAFLSAYDSPRLLSRYAALAPWYHARSFAYCLWQAHQGDKTAMTRAQAEHAALKGRVNNL
ncbi:phosphotransferase family protein [Roseovarius sp. MMSF_3281]|uniref:phosphotransferase family protein n=1 Tax=Roseovarius sp. MMSF_3281 TaxID=3046694 RepID=UPI00273D0DB1|nr:phosphotransferase [Roseovarius sp. MMSF_3281]